MYKIIIITHAHIYKLLNRASSADISTSCLMQSNTYTVDLHISVKHVSNFETLCGTVRSQVGIVLAVFTKGWKRNKATLKINNNKQSIIMCNINIYLSAEWKIKTKYRYQRMQYNMSEHKLIGYYTTINLKSSRQFFTWGQRQRFLHAIFIISRSYYTFLWTSRIFNRFWYMVTSECNNYIQIWKLQL